MTLVGIDWAEDHHDVTVMDEQGTVLAHERAAEGIKGAGRLHALIGDYADDPEQVTVGTETDRGLMAASLAAAGYQVYAINPKAVDRYRDRHCTVGREIRSRRRQGAGRHGPHRPPQPPLGAGL